MKFRDTAQAFLERVRTQYIDRMRTEYIESDDAPPAEWRNAPRASGNDVANVKVPGFEVEERQAGTATVIETRYRIRCECGRRWWSLDLSPTTCPRCNKLVTVHTQH
jgi:hypothetical protein